MSRLAFSLIVGLCALVHGTASAQTSEPGEAPIAPAPSPAALAEARHSFEVAERAFDEGDYEGAVTEFEAAYELTRAADLLFNIYLAQERAGHLVAASESLARYIDQATLEEEQRSLLGRRLERLRGRAQAQTPEAAAPEEETTVLIESSVALAQPVVAVEASAPPPPVIVETGPPSAAVGLLVTAGVFLVGFAVFAPLALVEDQDRASRCGHACLAGSGGTQLAYDVAADVSWIGAATLGTLGLILFFALPPERGERPPTASVTPWASPQGAGVTARWSL